MMTGLPWYKRNPRDFIEGCKGMPLDEVGAYSMLLDLMYMLGRPLTDSYDATGLAICNSAKLWRRVRDNLIARGKLYVTATGMLSNHRFDSELEGQHEARAKRSKAGKASGAARRKGGANPEANAVCPQSENQTKSGLETPNPLKNKGAGGTHVQQVFEQKEERDSTSEAKAPDVVTSLFANAQSEAPNAATIKAAVDAYNVVAKRVGWRACTAKLSDARRRKLVAHLTKRGGLPGWMRDLSAMEGERWTHGDAQRKRGHENWKFSLDDMFQANFRNRMDDAQAVADDRANDNDPLSDQRWACEKRRERGQWPGGMQAADISAPVRAEFPDLFAGASA